MCTFGSSTLILQALIVIRDLLPGAGLKGASVAARIVDLEELLWLAHIGMGHAVARTPHQRVVDAATGAERDVGYLLAFDRAHAERDVGRVSRNHLGREGLRRHHCQQRKYRKNHDSKTPHTGLFRQVGSEADPPSGR